MSLVAIVLSIAFMIAYGVLFLRPRYRLLSAALASASLSLLYLALYLTAVESQAVMRLSVIMLGASGIGAVGLLLAHVVFERGRAGRMTGTRGAQGGEKPPRELFP